MSKAAKKLKQEETPNNTLPFPVNTLDSYQLAAENLETEIWNLLIDEIDANFPTDWAAGILDRLKDSIKYLEDEE